MKLTVPFLPHHLLAVVSKSEEPKFNRLMLEFSQQKSLMMVFTHFIKEPNAFCYKYISVKLAGIDVKLSADDWPFHESERVIQRTLFWIIQHVGWCGHVGVLSPSIPISPTIVCRSRAACGVIARISATGIAVFLARSCRHI